MGRWTCRGVEQIDGRCAERAAIPPRVTGIEADVEPAPAEHRRRFARGKIRAKSRRREAGESDAAGDKRPRRHSAKRRLEEKCDAFQRRGPHLLPQSNRHQSCTERSCVRAMCCNYRLLNQRHYAFNCKRVDLSADVPYLQHGRLLLSLPSRSWLPPCRRGSELHLGGTGIGETGIEPGVDKRFQKGLCTIHRRVSLFLVQF